MNTSEKNLEAVIKQNLQRQKRERISKKISSSLIYWFFSSQPEQTHYPKWPRSSKEQAKYERFRAFISWTNIARLQNSYALKLGLGGLVFVPIFATIFLHLPMLQQNGFPLQFALLFLSGLSFVLSAILFKIRCPTLLQQMLLVTHNSAHTSRRQDLLEALVAEEFVDLVKPRRYQFHPDLFNSENRTDELAKYLIAQGGEPGFNGYGPYACALIERAIFEFANRQGIQIWEETFDKKEERLILTSRLGPSTVLEGAQPYVTKLHITKPNIISLEEYPEVGKNDLVLTWHDTHVDDRSRFPNNNEMDVHKTYAQGLGNFFSTPDFTETFSLIISRWQNYRRGMSRLTMLGLYGCSIGLFGGFLWLQTRIVLHAMGLI